MAAGAGLERHAVAHRARAAIGCDCRLKRVRGQAGAAARDPRRSQTKKAPDLHPLADRGARVASLRSLAESDSNSCGSTHGCCAQDQVRQDAQRTCRCTGGAQPLSAGLGRDGEVAMRRALPTNRHRPVHLPLRLPGRGAAGLAEDHRHHRHVFPEAEWGDGLWRRRFNGDSA